MSSIKSVFLVDFGRHLHTTDYVESSRQVQDLEKQLAQARRQLHELRSVAKEVENPRQVPQAHAERLLFDSETSSGQLSKPSVSQDLSRVRTSLHRVGAGLFKPPYPYNLTPPKQTLSRSGLPELPPRSAAEQILGQYRASFHTTLPILHWPSFISQYEAVYNQDSLRAVARIWGALFFAVLGCGTLERIRQDGVRYLEVSKSLVNPWDEEISLDHVRCALLTSIILIEMNQKSAGWVCLGTAVRMAQDIGLHCEAKSWPSAEDEMRRRVWWSIYTCDRYVV